ncbi:FadD3 family acyl-CoA ligase [Brevundimonas sp.]|uniref:FadD3 family acyl-CoA ligase n=1 Tax=Brevundimonas sp. TaxID=1871086 RepID=UPI003D6CB315
MSSLPADPYPLPATVPHAAQAAAARWGDVPGLIENGRTWTFAELWADARAAASAFLARGVKTGDVVAIWAPNQREWILAALGLQIAGAALVPLNTRLKGKEAGDILRRSHARLVFTVSDFLGVDYRALLAGEALPDLEAVLLLDPVSWDAFVASGAGSEDPAVDRALAAIGPDTRSDILFTSGTTGSPKGVISTHYQVVRLFRDWGRVVDCREGDRFIIANPFFHVFGYKAGWVATLTCGATIVPMPVFDVVRLAEIIERDRISFIPGPPTIYQMLLAEQARSPRDLSSLRVAVTGSAPVPPALILRMRDELGIERVVNGYGMTEFGAISMTPADATIEQISHTIGKPLPGVEVQCVDADGKVVGAGETGEFWSRGYGAMKGYLDDPAATAETIDAAGWLHTGDIGSIDADGYLRITDRKKDMYISGGFNCYPAEIEKLLNDHPQIEAAAVIGVPDERMGEVGRAFVILRPGESAASADIVAWARTHMANYKAPRSVVIVDAFPRNAAGKVLRAELKAL